MLHLFSFLISNYLKPSPGGGGYFQKKWVGVGICGTLPETFSLIISSLGQTNVKDNVYTLLLRRIQKSSNFRA